MTDQSTEFEAIKARHDACIFTVTKSEWNEREAYNAHDDRATLITLVESERARADKAEAELDAEQVAHLKTRARLTEAKAELAQCQYALHLASGTAVLAMQHRDDAEAELARVLSAAPATGLE